MRTRNALVTTLLRLKGWSSLEIALLTVVVGGGSSAIGECTQAPTLIYMLHQRARN